jgi:hypothetical protein
MGGSKKWEFGVQFSVFGKKIPRTRCVEFASDGNDVAARGVGLF